MKPVSPINYDLEFEPDFGNFTFRGRAKIQVSIGRPTRQITLNAADMQIKNCTINSNQKKLVAKARLDEKKEELVLSLPSKVSGKAMLVIDFVGALNDK